MKGNNITQIVLALAAAAALTGCVPIKEILRNPGYKVPYNEKVGTEAWRMNNKNVPRYMTPSPYAQRFLGRKK